VSLEKAQAIVIRQVDFSESSRVVTFFSREFGKFAALAKGARRLKGPFDAALDLLSECRVVFIKKSSGALNLLTEARLSNRFQPQNSDASRRLNSLYGGYYIAELLNGLTEDFDPAPDLFDLSVLSLAALTAPEPGPITVIIHFEISLLHLIGLLPNLSECSICGGTAQQTGHYAHWVSQGGLICHDCRREEYSGTSISAGSLEILRRLSESTPDQITRLKLNPQQTAECHRLALSAITQAMGRKPTTLRYLQF
jgi:DNA repair protein RecO (recombination protein O)